MANTYLMYVDESGQREYGSKTSRYFVLCALAVPVASWQLINNQLHTLKLSYFDNPTVEVKSSWLRFPVSRKKQYLDPYGISEASLTEFVDRLYTDILDRPELVLFASVVDKVQMTQQYVSPQSPSSLAYRLVFERLQHFLETREETSHGLVVFDKITDAAFQTQGYENLLSKQHLRYLMQGTDFVQIENIVEGLLFIPSHENNFIQLADLCSYNVFRQFKEQGSQWDDPSGDSLPMYPFFKRMVHHFYTSSGGVVSGRGIKKYPDHKKLGKPGVQWRLVGDAFSGWDVYQKGKASDGDVVF